MTTEHSPSSVAARGAETIFNAFVAYQSDFREITRRARSRFASRDWRARRGDALGRLDLYGRYMAGVVRDIQPVLSASLKERKTWAAMRVAYSRLIVNRADRDLAETFFNSATRQIFATVGVDPTIEYVDLHADHVRGEERAGEYVAFPNRGNTFRLILDVLGAFDLEAPFQDAQCDAETVAGRIDVAYPPAGGWTSVEFLRAPFHRNQGCYLVGRIRIQDRVRPLVLALVHRKDGIAVDAVLMTEADVSVVFSFTRSYFHVDVESPGSVIAFLRSLMPKKPVAELYMSLGYNKHGKTEFYRDLMRHVGHSRETFRRADGERGMVMVVFTMPSYDFVFKVIRDKFAYPKTVTRREVMARYRLVFRHDRVGRLVEALEFEHLAFARQLFSKALLEELLESAPASVKLERESVFIRHVYVERRVRPLDLYLREVGEDRARDAVSDYGQAISDLASTNIFAGDLLLKNFGVTRHGRVVFYDYDELCLLTDCHFRDLPTPRDDGEEMAAEPWFFVGQHDIFPEEFLGFLGLPKSLVRSFTAKHGRLLTPAFWRRLQSQHEAGDLVEFFPYPESRRLPCD